MIPTAATSQRISMPPTRWAICGICGISGIRSRRRRCQPAMTHCATRSVTPVTTSPLTTFPAKTVPRSASSTPGTWGKGASTSRIRANCSVAAIAAIPGRCPTASVRSARRKGMPAMRPTRPAARTQRARVPPRVAKRSRYTTDGGVSTLLTPITRLARPWGQTMLVVPMKAALSVEDGAVSALPNG